MRVTCVICVTLGEKVDKKCVLFFFFSINGSVYCSGGGGCQSEFFFRYHGCVGEETLLCLGTNRIEIPFVMCTVPMLIFYINNYFANVQDVK